MMDLIKRNTPKIGMRIIKSAVAVYICFLFYAFVRKDGIIFYSQLAALWSIQPQKDTMKGKAIQRIVGTMIGAFFGLIVLLVDKTYLQDKIYAEVFYGLIVALAVIASIYVTLIINKKDASYFSCVVLLSIVVVHISDANPYSFVASRVIDTLIGIMIGMLVNSFHLPRRKRKDILFISGVDDTLLEENKKLSPYSYVELNHMLSDGANFTISTKRTPASLIELLRGVHLRLPVIAMDGAVLYDMNLHEYLYTYVISVSMVKNIRSLLDRFGVNYFMNMLIDNTLVIQYKEIKSEAEKDIYARMRRSPYRNYINCDVSAQAKCIYIMLIDQTEKIRDIHEALNHSDMADKLRIVSYASDDYPGYSYIKIYNKNATRSNMTEYLKRMTGLKQSITFGSIENAYDVVVKEYDRDKVVTTLKKMYEPLWWKKYPYENKNPQRPD